MELEKPALRYSYYACAFLFGAVLVSSFFVLRPDFRVFIIAVFIVRILIEYLRAIILKRRKFEYKSQLSYRWSVWDYVGIASVLILTAYIFWDPNGREKIHQFTWIILIIPHIRIPFNNSPAFVITTDKLIQNEIMLKERNLELLHSIELTTLPRGFRIYFAEDYAIKIPKGGCTNRELCDFVNVIIDQAPVAPYIHPEAREFLEKHSSKSPVQ